MRISLLIAAGLMVTACEGRDTDPVQSGPTGAVVGDADNDAAAGFAAQTPSAAEFVQRAAMSDMYEIAAGKLAVEKSTSAQVNDFGKMMVADHTRSSAQLKAAVQQSGQTLDIPTRLGGEQQAQVDILRNLSGPDFDREYLNQQLAAHRQTLALLKAYAGNGDIAELRQFAQGAIPVVQKHHDELEQSTGGIPGATTSSTPMIDGTAGGATQ